jgi:hypothetical protein
LQTFEEKVSVVAADLLASRCKRRSRFSGVSTFYDEDFILGLSVTPSS